jgi:hypothetical protein
MAVIYIRTIDAATGLEVPASGLRTGSPAAAAEHAIRLTGLLSEPEYITKVIFTGSFTDPAFAELTQLVQEHGLHLDAGDG